MIISEVNAVLDLVGKATTFTSQLQDGWYKGSAELDTFQEKVWVLSAKHAQWSEQLQRYGMFEDKHLLRLVKAAEEAIEKQQQSLLKLQKSPFRRWQKRVFPGQLSCFLDKVLEIVDAGPQLLASRVANNDLLERYLAQTPASLPFGPDRNYVPIANSILRVRNTLEKADGPQVVTLYGGPGMGKSSLMKYLAVHYQEEHKRLRTDASFAHGVYYLFCGQHAGKRVKQLQLILLQSLGFGTGSTTPNESTTTSAGVEEGDLIALPSNQTKLMSLLAEQQLLIMLDDVWDAKVLLELLVPAKGVKYLVTSQMRDICCAEEQIQIKSPNLEESTQILANYTNGLPEKGEFPHNIKRIAEDVVEMLEYHPLSLANIGISINSSRATDIKQWEGIKKDLYIHLDDNESQMPIAYHRPYDLPVSASMMLMVESLPSEEVQRLLFLVALLGGQDLPETIVKYFYSFVQTENFLVKYNNHERCLEGKSLIELTVQGERSTLHARTLRKRYILDRKKLDVRSVASKILAARPDQVRTDEDFAKLIRRGDAEETLVTVLSAVYFHQSLNDLVAGAVENHMNVINNWVIPRSLNMETGTLDLVNSARKKFLEIKDLIWLLNADHEEENWKRQAHECAKKIIIKFVCQGKLEDNSMAVLLRLPQTTSAALAALCQTLSYCHSVQFTEQNVTFSKAYVETMRALFDLFHNNAISMEAQIDVIYALLLVLNYECEENIHKFSAEWVKLFAMKSNNNFRQAATSALVEYYSSSNYHDRTFVIMAEFPAFYEPFFAVLVEPGVGDKLRAAVGEVISHFCQYRYFGLKIAVMPDALEKLFLAFLSDGTYSKLRESVGDALCSLSSVPKNRINFKAIEGILDGLGGILTRLEKVWRASHEDLDRRHLKQQASAAAEILGYLALEKDLTSTIASLPGLRQGLLFLQLIEMATSCRVAMCPGRQTLFHVFFHCSLSHSTRTLIVLYLGAPSNPGSIDMPKRGDLLKLFPCNDGILSSNAPSLMVGAQYIPPDFPLLWRLEVLPCNAGTLSSHTPSMMIEPWYLGLYWTRARAYAEMGYYAQGLKSLDLAIHYLDLTSKQDPRKHHPNLTSKEDPRKLHPDLTLNRQVYVQVPYDPANVKSGCDFAAEELRDCWIFLQAMVGEYARALLVANKRLDDGNGKIWHLAERGVLKRLSGDLQGALDDLNNAAKAKWIYPVRKEVLCQRGYVKYLMDDKAGAKEDAELAKEWELKNFNTRTAAWEIQHHWLLIRIPVSYLGCSF